MLAARVTGLARSLVCLAAPGREREGAWGALLAGLVMLAAGTSVGAVGGCGPSYEGLARSAEGGDRVALERLLDVAASDDLHGFTGPMSTGSFRPELLTEGQQAASALAASAPALRSALLDVARAGAPPARAAASLAALAASKTAASRAELAGSPCFAPASGCFRELVWLAAVTWPPAEVGELASQAIAARSGDGPFFRRLFDGLASLEREARASIAARALASLDPARLELPPGATLDDVRARLPLVLDLGPVIEAATPAGARPSRLLLCRYVHVVVAWAPLQAGSSDVDVRLAHHRESLALHSLDTLLGEPGVDGGCPARPDLDVGPLITELHDNDVRAAVVRSVAKKAGVGAKATPVAAP